MQKNKLIHCYWSINNKEEGTSALKPTANISGNWSDEDLTEPGKLVKKQIINWKQ